MNGKELLNFANKLEDDNKDKGYKWLYDKLRYEIIKKHQEAINFIPCCAELKDKEEPIIANITKTAFTTPSDHGIIEVELPYQYYKMKGWKEGDKIELKHCG